MNADPYRQLGNTNGFSSSAVWGKCGSQLEKLNIHINTTRATALVAPFMQEGTWCSQQGEKLAEEPPVNCSALNEEQCGAASAHCSFCESKKSLIDSGCYEKLEATVLTHILKVEDGEGTFVCKA